MLDAPVMTQPVHVRLVLIAVLALLGPVACDGEVDLLGFSERRTLPVLK